MAAQFGAHPYPFYRRQLFGRGLWAAGAPTITPTQCDSCELVSVALLCQAIYYIPPYTTGTFGEWCRAALSMRVSEGGAGHLTGQRIYLSISILDIPMVRCLQGSRENLPQSLNQPGKYWSLMVIHELCVSF